MKGYVKNIGKAPIYIFKGVVNFNDVIPFDDLLKRFGDVADISSEEAFAKWLLKYKFLDKNRWKVVPGVKSKKSVTKKIAEDSKVSSNLNEVNEISKASEVSEVSEVSEASEDNSAILEQENTVSKVTAVNKEIIKKSVTGVKQEMTVDYIINMKVADIKRDIDKIDNLRLLKVALKKAEGMQKKATLCNALRDRITTLSVR